MKCIDHIATEPIDTAAARSKYLLTHTEWDQRCISLSKPNGANVLPIMISTWTGSSIKQLQGSPAAGQADQVGEHDVARVK